MRRWTRLHFSLLFVSLFFLRRKLHLFPGKSTKAAVTKAALFDSIICAKSFVGCGFAPDPTGEA